MLLVISPRFLVHPRFGIYPMPAAKARTNRLPYEFCTLVNCAYDLAFGVYGDNLFTVAVYHR